MESLVEKNQYLQYFPYRESGIDDSNTITIKRYAS